MQNEIFFIKRGLTFCVFQNDIERFIKKFVFLKGSNIILYVSGILRLEQYDTAGRIPT